jgi:hypothetical protein
MLFRRSAKGRSPCIVSTCTSSKAKLGRAVELETLEERRLLTTITVTSNSDALIHMGTTLRDAIVMANLLPGADTVQFSIAGTPTIHPITALPDVTGATIIDGTTQPGTHSVFIEGTGTIPAPLTLPDDGLRLTGSNITLRGLAIGGFTSTDAAGVRIFGDNNAVVGSWIGTDPSGAADGNFNGIIVESASNTSIGSATSVDHNLISANFLDGVQFNGDGSGNVVAGNYIGVDISGNIALPNGLSGINVQLPGGVGTNDVLIGGSAAGAGNVISGNNFNGVTIDSVSGVQLQGNIIGLNAGGTMAIRNDANGIQILGSAGSIDIGGAAAGARNVISGNAGDGVQVDSSGSGTVIHGNIIGPDINGTAAIPLSTQANGVSVLSGSVQIGGAAAAEGNLISANEQNGINLIASGNDVENNRIGTAANGTTALANAGDGIYIDGSDNTIGTPGTGNTIAYNGGTGISVAFSPADLRNAIRGDNIYLNGRLGIDLGDDGVTMNDPQDVDSGPNEFQNFPVLTAITLSGGTATISGTLNSTPSSTFAIDLFVSQIWDTSTYGEGQKYLGSTTVTTDAAGNASFTTTVSGVPAGWNYFAATATDSVGNTSEFAYDPTPGASPQAQAAAPSAAAAKKDDKSSSLRDLLV